jgi:hypothetical protein
LGGTFEGVCAFSCGFLTELAFIKTKYRKQEVKQDQLKHARYLEEMEKMEERMDGAKPAS